MPGHRCRQLLPGLLVLACCGCGAAPAARQDAPARPAAAAPPDAPVVQPLPPAPPARVSAAGAASRPDTILRPRGWTSGAAAWSNPTTIAIIRSAPGKAVEIGYADGGHDKAIISHPMSGAIPAHACFTCTVINAGSGPVQVAVAFKSGPGWLYQESAPQTIAVVSGPQSISVDLEAAVFKSEDTGWLYAGAIRVPLEMHEVQLLILNGRQSGRLRLLSAGIATTAAPSTPGSPIRAAPGHS